MKKEIIKVTRSWTDLLYKIKKGKHKSNKKYKIERVKDFIFEDMDTGKQKKFRNAYFIK